MIVPSVFVKAAVLLTAALNKDDFETDRGILNRLPFIPSKFVPMNDVAHQEFIPMPPIVEDDVQGQVAVVRGGDEVKKGSFLKKHPFAGALMITTLNAFSADLMTQLVFEKNPWNPQRSAVFASFGFLYQGIVQYAIVNYLWEKLFPGNSKKSITSKVFAMNLLSDPLFFMPTFYIFRETLAQGAIAWATVKAALLGYKANCLLDWRNSWMVWFPGHAVTYGVMKPHQRIPWMACLGFIYMTVLSVTRGTS